MLVVVYLSETDIPRISSSVVTFGPGKASRLMSEFHGSTFVFRMYLNPCAIISRSMWQVLGMWHRRGHTITKIMLKIVRINFWLV